MIGVTLENQIATNEMTPNLCNPRRSVVYFKVHQKMMQHTARSPMYCFTSLA